MVLDAQSKQACECVVIKKAAEREREKKRIVLEDKNDQFQVEINLKEQERIERRGIGGSGGARGNTGKCKLTEEK